MQLSWTRGPLHHQFWSAVGLGSKGRGSEARADADGASREVGLRGALLGLPLLRPCPGVARALQRRDVWAGVRRVLGLPLTQDLAGEGWADTLRALQNNLYCNEFNWADTTAEVTMGPAQPAVGISATCIA